MENTIQDILTTYVKPITTYKWGANHLKNRFQECGMEFMPDDEFMEYMTKLGHKKNKDDKYKLQMKKIKN